MYAIQKSKTFISFILIILITLISCTGIVLESNSYAAVVATGMSVKALWVAIAAISAGVVFTSPQGVNDFTEGVLRDLERVTPNTGGFTDAEYDQLLRDVNDKFGNAKKKLPKPPNPNQMKNKLLFLGGSASILADKILDWLEGIKPDEGVPEWTIPNGANSELGFVAGVSNIDSLRYYVEGVSSLTRRSDGVYVASLSRGARFYNYKEKKWRSVGGNAFTFSILHNASPFLLEQVGFTPTIPEPETKPKPRIPGVVVPEKLPDKVDPKKAPILPVPVPQMPPLPSTEVYPTPNPYDWSDFGFDTEPVIVPSPDPSPNPNPDPNPNPQEVQQPTKYPQVGQSEMVEMDSGVQPSDLVGLNQQGLNQWLQNNTWNITNNSYTDNKLDIDDPDFDNIEFDFSPLSDIGRALITRFPFCIPFDLVDSFKLMGGGKAEAPVFDLPIKSKNSTVNIKLDFNEFEKLAMLSRVSLTIIFIVALMFITSKTIKW